MDSTLQSKWIVRLIGLVAALNPYFNFADIVADRGLEHQIYVEYETLKKNENKSNIPVYIVTKKNCPTLYKLVEKSAVALKIRMPSRFLIFKGNVISKIGEEMGIFDIKVKIFAIKLTHNFSFICIGEDVIKDLGKRNGLTIPMFQGTVLHELGHVKHSHMLKLVIPSIILLCMTCLIGSTLSALVTDVSNLLPTLLEALLALIMSAIETHGCRLIMMTNVSYEFLKEMGGVLLDSYLTLIIKCINPVIAKYVIPLILMFSILIATFYIKMYLSRRYEKEADAEAAKILDDPTILADALDRLDTIELTKPRTITWLINWFQSRPRNCDRRAALEQVKAAKVH
jgi:hypothetical protein